jgi:hypothetical protein
MNKSTIIGALLAVLFAVLLYGCSAPEIDTGNLESSIKEVQTSIEDPEKREEFEESIGFLAMVCGMRVTRAEGNLSDAPEERKAEATEEHCEFLDGKTADEVIDLADEMTDR